MVDKPGDSEYNNIVNFMRFIKFDCEKFGGENGKSSKRKLWFPLVYVIYFVGQLYRHLYDAVYLVAAHSYHE